ncbi:MAG: trehalose-6-phosphate synthase [Acidimicrobiales bacterium]|nr:trehalose-6-phosphate synthase [Acidimicrobiales bacterium]
MPGGPPGADGRLADTVVVSNRGPLAFQFKDGRPVAGPVGGGLAGSLAPLLLGTGATWVASTMEAADRQASAEGLMVADGLRLEMVEPDPEVYSLAYNVVSNAALWFCHHHLFDAPRRPYNGRQWGEAWDAYRELNQQFAARVAKVAPEGGRVLVQDYHLALLGSELAGLRPDLRTVHFTHTPFADASVLRMLPTATTNELLEGMAGFDACGFHTARWAEAYGRANDELRPRHSSPEGAPHPSGSEPPTPRLFVSPLAPDPEELRQSVESSEVSRARDQLDELIGADDRSVLVRVDRMELSKNLLRGFLAFDELLESEPHLRQRVVFLAMAYPTRESLAEYVGYRNEVEALVDRVNERWATDDWTPILLDVEDDYPRSLAALTRADALLVNPIRDGLNLVAKEGPLVNRRDGVLLLSREAGAFEELGGPALELNPFDVAGTAAALAQALAMEPEERAGRAAALRRLITARAPTDWLDDQLRAAG